MAVSFPHIPANIRVPLFYADVDNSQASYFSQNQRALIIGQALATATVPFNIPVLTTTASQAVQMFGVSHLSDLVSAYRLNDDFGELWCLPLADIQAGTAAQGAFTVTGTAAVAGTITLRVHDQRVLVGVNSGDGAAVIATAIANAINAAGLLVTAAANAAQVGLTAIHRGTMGNEILLSVNLLGALAGETLPAGVQIAVTAMVGGQGDPDLSAALANLGDQEFDFIVCPYTDPTSLNAVGLFLNDTTGRWAWTRQIYGGAFSARRGTVGQLVAFGLSRNDQHVSVMGCEVSSPSPTWRRAAAYAAQAANSIRADPARPLQTLPLLGISPPALADRCTLSERQTLLSSGVATSMVGGDGSVMIEREVTTYQKNQWGQTDPSYLDVVTLYQLMYVIRFIRQRITTKYGRHKLANDGTRFGAGQAIVTPNILRAEMISAYREMETAGIVENGDLFAKYLIVERDANDPNRVNCLFPPDLVNQLRVFAANVQFRLQYPANA